jgi:DNA-binding NtrC family response regulator
MFEKHESDISAVLLDMTMPRMGGEETLLEIRKRNETVPVILSSGYNQQDATTRFVEQGASAFIQKPYRSRALLDLLRNVMGADDD